MGHNVAFKIFDALPSRAGAFATTLVTLFGVAYPDRVRAWADWLVTPEQIKWFSAWGVGICLAYWAIWFWLRSRQGPTAPPSGTQINVHGGHVGQIGDQHHYHAEDKSLKRRLRDLLRQIDPAILNTIDQGTLAFRARMADYDYDALCAMAQEPDGKKYLLDYTMLTVLNHCQIGEGLGPKGMLPLQFEIELRFTHELKQ